MKISIHSIRHLENITRQALSPATRILRTCPKCFLSACGGGRVSPMIKPGTHWSYQLSDCWRKQVPPVCGDILRAFVHVCYFHLIFNMLNNCVHEWVYSPCVRVKKANAYNNKPINMYLHIVYGNTYVCLIGSS